MKIGFIGLGIMGKPMAKNLLKAGYPLVVNDLVEAAVEEVAACGALTAVTPAEVAAQSDVVITMLPNSPHVRTVLAGENGVLEGIKTGSTVVDMSSIDPGVSVELSRLVAEKGCELVDAPVSGGEPKAIDGTLSIMCGGSQAAFDRVYEILKCMGASVVRVGDVGSGNMTKLANQIIVASNIAAVSEAFTLAAKSGVDPDSVFQAIRGGLAGSTVMEAKMPMILNRNFEPGFRIELHIKDLNNALQAGKTARMDLPLTELTLGMMELLQKEGYGGKDHSALVRYYEERNEVEVKK